MNIYGLLKVFFKERKFVNDLIDWRIKIFLTTFGYNRIPGYGYDQCQAQLSSLEEQMRRSTRWKNFISIRGHTQTQYGLSFSLCSTQLEATRDRLREVSSYYDRSLRKLKADIAKVSNAGVWSTIKANRKYPNNNYYLNTKPCYGLIFMFYFAFSSLIYFRKPQKSKFFGSKWGNYHLSFILSYILMIL